MLFLAAVCSRLVEFRLIGLLVGIFLLMIDILFRILFDRVVSKFRKVLDRIAHMIADSIVRKFRKYLVFALNIEFDMFLMFLRKLFDIRFHNSRNLCRPGKYLFRMLKSMLA